ncbi:MAG TPA: hypothetical protein VNT32_10710 [Thermoleophilaceae bacterium]|nr:hypothetical protein [Thermoleophilaceae bacterium]
MRTPILALLVPALLLAACGGREEDRRPPSAADAEAVIARWVEDGDCGLYTDRYVAGIFGPGQAGRRACQRTADDTPQEAYRVHASRVEHGEAIVTLAVAGDKRYTFWLVPAEGGWRIDGFEERRPGDGKVGLSDVIAAVERRTGERLDRLPELSRPDYEALGLRALAGAGDAEGEAADRAAALAERLGIFTILVAHDADLARDSVPGEGPDERGIHWRRIGPRADPSWQANKRYGNVVLSWAGGSRRTDHTFDLLDGILTRAARSAR